MRTVILDDRDCEALLDVELFLKEEFGETGSPKAGKMLDGIQRIRNKAVGYNAPETRKGPTRPSRNSVIQAQAADAQAVEFELLMQGLKKNVKFPKGFGFWTDSMQRIWLIQNQKGKPNGTKG